MSGVGTQALPDVTGQLAFDQGGGEIGRIAGVYLDNATNEPEWADVDLDGSELTLVPLAGATSTPDGVRAAFQSEYIEDAPYRASRLPRAVSEEDDAELKGHSGLQPPLRRRRQRRAPPSPSEAAAAQARSLLDETKGQPQGRAETGPGPAEPPARMSCAVSEP